MSGAGVDIKIYISDHHMLGGYIHVYMCINDARAVHKEPLCVHRGVSLRGGCALSNNNTPAQQLQRQQRWRRRAALATDNAR